MTSVVFRALIIQFIIALCGLSARAENVEIVTPENTKPVVVEEPKNVTTVFNISDSYVRAYEEVQKLRGPVKRNDYYDPPDKDKQGYNTVIRSSYMTDEKYPSLTQHWMPPHDASPPSTVYGPPLHHDPSPTPPVYGPPHSHHHHELVVPTHCHSIPYSSPSSSSSSSFFGFLPKKITLKLLLKILLKLVLFKMIVKFIAVICLLLFLPALKGKETSGGGEEERRKGRALDEMTNMIWESLENKNSVYGGDGEVKDIAEMALDDDDSENDNYFSGPLRAVKFLEFCVSTVDRVVGFMLGILNRQKNEGDDLSSFVLEKLGDFVKNV